MIKGKPYSQASDIWSAGVLLYSITTGRFPFDGENLEALFRKIVTQEIAYPTFLSRAFVNLLRRMLAKDPDLRISLPEIREHDWLSESHYAALLTMDLRARMSEIIVDSELVEHMNQLGIETTSLEQQLSLGVFTELTAMYRMLRKHRVTDAMQELLAGLPAQAGVGDFPRGVLLARRRESTKPRLIGPMQIMRAMKPGLLGQGAKQITGSPSPVSLVARPRAHPRAGSQG
jgi:hypothetical protein